MTKELIERLRNYSRDKDILSSIHRDAADAIESLQAENERLIADNKSFDAANTEMIGDVNTLIKERDALAAKLVPLQDYDAKHLLSLIPHYFGDTGDMYGMRVLRFIEAAHGIQAKGCQHEDA